MTLDSRLATVIWATRGRSWGFRFLLDGGFADPLPEYERAFGEAQDAPSAWRRDDTRVALRFLDPQRRRDSAGRVIPHEFVVEGSLADLITSVEDGLRLVWPLVADVYEGGWSADSPPSIDLE